MPLQDNINIDHLAKLARIALAPEEKIHIANDLGTILQYFQELENVDVAGVTPGAHAFPLFNVLREDQPGPLLDTGSFAKIAPAFRDDQVLVPRVVNDEG